MAGRTVGGSATRVARMARLAAGRGAANDEAFAVLLDLSLGGRVEISNDICPGRNAIERGDPIFQCPLQHQGEKAADRVTANGHIELVEDRPCREQMFGRSEGLLTRPKLLAAQHGLKRVEMVRSTNMASNFASSSTLV